MSCHAARCAYLGLADRLGRNSILGSSGGGWPTDGQHVNVRRQAKHRPGPGQGGVWSELRRDSPTGTARRARRSHRYRYRSSHRAPGPNRACTNARPTGPRRASCTCRSMAISDTVMSCLNMTRRHELDTDSTELHPPPRTDPTHTGGPAPRDARPDRNRTTCL